MARFSKDVFNAFWLLQGRIDSDGPMAETTYPTATTTPTERECYAAVARLLKDVASEMDDPDQAGEHAPWILILSALAECFDPASKHRSRVVKIKNENQGYETDVARDASIARLVEKLRKTKGPKRAISEAAVIVGRSPKAVREARKRVARRLKRLRNEGYAEMLRKCNKFYRKSMRAFG